MTSERSRVAWLSPFVLGSLVAAILAQWLFPGSNVQIARADDKGSLLDRLEQTEKQLEAVTKELTELKKHATTTDETVQKNYDTLLAAVKDARVKVATHEWVFGLGNVKQGDRVPAPGWVP